MGKKKKVTIGHKYFMGLHMGLGRGPFDLIREIRIGDKTAWLGNATGNTTIKIDKPDLFGGEEQEGGIQGDLVVLMGAKDQQRHAGLAQMLGGLVSAFRGVVTTYFDGMVCAMSQYPKPWAYRVRRIQMGWHGGECWYPEKAAIKLGERMLISGSDRPWRYLVVPNSDAIDRSAIGFDDSAWPSGTTPFASKPWDLPGDYGFETEPATTVPEAQKVWMRTLLDLGAVPQQLRFQAFVDNDCRVYVNGTFVLEVGGNNGAYHDVSMPSSAFVVGSNSIAVVGWDRHSGAGNWFWFDWRIVDSTNDDLFGMNPAHILYQVYTDPRMGRGLLPAARLDDAAWRAAADAFAAEGLGLCLKWARSGSIAEFAQQVIDHAGAALYTSRRTGLLVLKPIRDDYDIDDLPLFTPDTGLLGIDDDASSAQAQGVNEIVVKYFDPFDKREKAIRERNLGAILAADGVAVTEEVSYPGLATEALARRIARRDLNAKGGFIKRFEVRLDRRGKDLAPGGVFRISDPVRGIDSMVLRAGSIDYGTVTGGTITVTALQDVFGMPATVLREPKDSSYVPPDTIPRVPYVQRAIEAPYRDLVQRIGAKDADSLDPSAGYLLGLAVPPSGMSMSFDLYARVAPAAFELRANSGAFCPGAKLKTGINKKETVLAIQESVQLAEVQIGSAALINNEIVRVDSIDVGAGLLTVGRACADTVPAEHSAGSSILFYDTLGAEDATEYTAGVDVQARLLTRTSAGALPLAGAVTVTAPFSSRAARPYPPASVRFNGESYPEEVSGTVATTWAHRDRLLQADTLVDTTAASIGPEPGTSYSIHYFDESGTTPLTSETGITGETATPWTPPNDGRFRIEILSVRSGLESLQRVAHVVQLGAAEWTPGQLPAPPKIWLDDDSELIEAAGAASQWSDRSGNGNHFSQNSAGSRPGIIASALAGRRALRFDGTNDYVEAAATGSRDFSRNAPYAWLLTVARRQAGNSLGCIFGVTNGDSPGSARINAGFNYPAAGGVYAASAKTDAGAEGVAQASGIMGVGDWHIVLQEYDYAGNRLAIWLDGRKITENTSAWASGSNTSNSASYYPLRIGAWPTDGNYLSADVASLMAGSSQFEAGDIDRLQGWAAWRYGLVEKLPTLHPYKNSPPKAGGVGVGPGPGFGSPVAMENYLYDGQRFIAARMTDAGMRFYGSTDGASFEYLGTMVDANVISTFEEGVAKGSVGYASFPKYYAYTGGSQSWFSIALPDFARTHPPRAWSSSVIGSPRPLCIAWDAAGGRFLRIMEDKTITESVDGLAWTTLGAMALPEVPGGWTWYTGMRMTLFRSGAYWYAMHCAGGARYQADSTMLMRSTDLTTWALCLGTGFYSPPPGVAGWQFFMVYAVAHRGSTFVITARGRRSSAPDMRELVLRSTDGESFSLVYEAAAFNTTGDQDFKDVKPVGASGYVAAGPGGLLCSADDGLTWSRQAMAPTPTALRSDGYTVVASRATASGGENECWYTTNGVDWSRSTVQHFNSGLHRHWRLRAVSAAGDVTFGELAFFSGASKLVGYSKSQGAGMGLENVDDGNASTAWQATAADLAAGSSWVAFDMGATTDVTAVTLQAPAGDSTRMPKGLEIEASDDGATWKPVWFVAGLAWSAGEVKRMEKAP